MKKFGLNELTAENTKKVSECVVIDLWEAASYFKVHYQMDPKKNYEVFEIDGASGNYIMFGNMNNDSLLFQNLKMQLESEGYCE